MAEPSPNPDAGAGPDHACERPWERVTLAISGFGDARATETILNDWFAFIGGRPAEVVYVDGGSPPGAGRTLLSLLHRGLIDRLELVNPASWENSFHRCYIQEHESGILARSPYILFVKPDVLPLRRGHDGWLGRDLAVLDDPAIFALTMTHLIDPPRERRCIRGAAYDVHDFASLNFSLMKRSAFRHAMHDQLGPFIDGGFRGDFPPHITCEERYRRALIEWAWQGHCRSRGLVTVARPESRDWMIFHINKYGRKLLALRRRMHALEDVERHFDQPRGLYRPAPRGISKLGRRLEGLARRIRKRGR